MTDVGRVVDGEPNSNNQLNAGHRFNWYVPKVHKTSNFNLQPAGAHVPIGLLLLSNGFDELTSVAKAQNVTQIQVTRSAMVKRVRMKIQANARPMFRNSSTCMKEETDTGSVKEVYCLMWFTTPLSFVLLLCCVE